MSFGFVRFALAPCERESRVNLFSEEADEERLNAVRTTEIDGTTQPRVRQRRERQKEIDSLTRAKRNEVEGERRGERGEREREKEEAIRVREKGRSMGER